MIHTGTRGHMVAINGPSVELPGWLEWPDGTRTYLTDVEHAELAQTVVTVKADRLGLPVPHGERHG